VNFSGQPDALATFSALNFVATPAPPAFLLTAPSLAMMSVMSPMVPKALKPENWPLKTA